ncbi:nuclease [Methanolobus sediminis]|uniref:Nuclease n=1 Tax=Methanolobus sediminis TaxID=3072978 RepID=A0AA51YJY3_9EURY|nr:nuclease [Methanolobus sediminis]WMW26005.1 nuclease [Methanolobus sediminis]
MNNLKLYLDRKWHSATVVRYIDGDTFLLNVGIKIRLSNVRAHELHQYGGMKAKRTLSGMIGRHGRKIKFKGVHIDRDRLVAEVKNGDGSINDRMRKKGYRSKGR